MSKRAGDTSVKAHSQAKGQTVALVLLILIGIAGAVALSRWMERHRPPVDASLEEERLYVTGAIAKRMSLGFSGLVADWYWMRSLQYVGRKVLAYQGEIQLDDLSALNLQLLPQLLDTATTLDPQFMAPYEYGAVVLPAINDQDAVALLEKGIKANPSAWRLYHHLGYIYWQREDYHRASEIYSAGAKLPGAPQWMQEMSARMAAEGGSRDLARTIYQRMYEQADDPQVKKTIERRLLQIVSFEQRDVIRRLLADFGARAGRCVSSWREIAPALRAARLQLDASGAPLDPANTPYVLAKDGCDVDLDPRSLVPYR